tara:strand:+ start:1850 stop:2425 length:576 start_codon:yes stop_codon:yes gene_type:complete
MSNSMIGYSNRNGSGVIAVEHSWNLGELEKLGKFLVMSHPTYEDAKELVHGGIVVLKGEPKEYEHLDRYGEVIENRIHWNKENYKPHIKHLYCHMAGVWKYSDDGIYWEVVQVPLTELYDHFVEQYQKGKLVEGICEWNGDDALMSPESVGKRFVEKAKLMGYRKYEFDSYREELEEEIGIYLGHLESKFR